MPPRAICLEVTETAVLRRPDVARRALDALRVLGVRVALDDFGLGYSSLTHLKALPVDVVKVDRSFVADLVRAPRTARSSRPCSRSPRRMGLTVIAEGVETADQDELLREMGCPVVQGYLYGRPVPPADVLLPASPRRAPTGAHGRFRRRLLGARPSARARARGEQVGLAAAAQRATRTSPSACSASRTVPSPSTWTATCAHELVAAALQVLGQAQEERAAVQQLLVAVAQQRVEAAAGRHALAVEAHGLADDRDLALVEPGRPEFNTRYLECL